MLRYTPKCITTGIFVINELLSEPFRSLVCVVGNTGWRQRKQKCSPVAKDDSNHAIQPLQTKAVILPR